MEEVCEAVMTVTEAKTARAMGSGDLPVLATPAMIALMENAAMRCAARGLPQGITTVGTRIEVSHDRASAVGARITARATLLEKTERTFTFRVEAFEGETRIGAGTHTRATVQAERFLAKLNRGGAQ